MKKIKTPLSARGHRAIKRIPKTRSATLGREMPLRKVDQIWHSHRVKGMRDIARIAWAPWEAAVTDALHSLETSRYEQANREHFAITKINALLETVRRRSAQLQDLIRELEAFSYSVSHDLRAPLRAIAGFSSILMEDHAHKLDEDATRHLRKIQSNAEHMGRLIDDLLEFSRTGRREMRESEIDMGAIVRQVYDELKPTEPRREIELKVGALPPARGDRAMLHQVWTNLLSNAMKYTRRRDRAVIEVTGRRDAHLTEYTVRDNGIGFDPQYAGQLFEVFQRLNPRDEFEGTGVGLALVKRIVDRHGGKVWAVGRPGEGAEFTFSLPV